MCAPVCAGVDACVWRAQSLWSSRLGIFFRRQPPAACLTLPTSPVCVDTLRCVPSASWVLSPGRSEVWGTETGGRRKDQSSLCGGWWVGRQEGCSQGRRLWGCRASRDPLSAPWCPPLGLGAGPCGGLWVGPPGGVQRRLLPLPSGSSRRCGGQVLSVRSPTSSPQGYFTCSKSPGVRKGPGPPHSGPLVS